MTGLNIEITLSSEDRKNAVLMECNYPEIHRKAIWEKVIFPGNIFECLASGIQRPLIKKKYMEMIESFKQKVKEPTKTNYYIDEIARSVELSVPTEIKPIPKNHYFGGVLISGDLAYQGISLDEGDKRDIEYIITRGTS